MSSETELDRMLVEVEHRVLWLATAIVDHANRLRPDPSGLKVGGHQASCASMVTIATALWLEHLRAEDRVSVKPHASPVLHALEYLPGHGRVRLRATSRPRRSSASVSGRDHHGPLRQARPPAHRRPLRHRDRRVAQDPRYQWVRRHGSGLQLGRDHAVQDAPNRGEQRMHRAVHRHSADETVSVQLQHDHP